MATHQDYKKFAVKYNREFKIAGVHKMKKADLINAIEERLNKSRKEIKDEYKQLKEMKKEDKKPSISDEDIKSNFTLDMSYFKLLGAAMNGKLNDNDLQKQLKKSEEAAKLFRKKKLSPEQKKRINVGLKNIKDLIKTNKENKKKDPAPKTKPAPVKKAEPKKTPVKKEPKKKVVPKKAHNKFMKDLREQPINQTQVDKLDKPNINITKLETKGFSILAHFKQDGKKMIPLRIPVNVSNPELLKPEKERKKEEPKKN